uniref:Uncharacterized protein n=1 Tax=Oryza sativa subsp. japonica TaxID=39947 RepID=Q69LV7_ORYSJ|nr:hypothetical protein [Oryza sativa Japonica Group]
MVARVGLLHVAVVEARDPAGGGWPPSPAAPRSDGGEGCWRRCSQRGERIRRRATADVEDESSVLGQR